MARKKKIQPKKTKELIDINFYQTKRDGEFTAYGDIYKIRRQLAKTANERMRRLERTTSKISGEAFNFGAYDIAQSYLESTDQKARFSEGFVKSRDINDVLREIAVLQKFLKSKSSTISGMREIEKKRIETFKKGGDGQYKNIAVATTREFYNFLNSDVFKELVSKNVFTSEQLIEAYDDAIEKEAKPEDLINALIEYKAQEDRASYKGLKEKFNAVTVKGSKNE